jgi:predicted esterase
MLLLFAFALCICVITRALAFPPRPKDLAEELGKYSISDITVSGISSGGYFAVQMHVAYSSIINGSATFAAGPYYCAESSVAVAENRCMDTTLGPPQVDLLIAATNEDHLLGLIDSPANIKDDRIYIFSGSMDTVINPTVVHSLYTYYQAFAQAGNIVADYNIPAEHCIPTLEYGEQCSTLSSPYIGKCSFDGAGAAFKTLYGASVKPSVPEDVSSLRLFNQKPFLPAAGNGASLGDNGYIYVPKACESGLTTCHLHISFHGCLQNIELIGNEYAAHAGFNPWAEANNVDCALPVCKSVASKPDESQRVLGLVGL